MWEKLAASELDSGVGKSKHGSFKSCLSVCYNFMALRTQVLLIFKVRCFGGFLSGASPTSWGAWCGVQTICSLGRSSGLGVSSWLWGWRLWWDCVPASSTHFSVVIFLFSQCVVVTQPAFRFSLRRTCSICSCRLSVSMGKGDFQVFLCYHLESEANRSHRAEEYSN